VGLREINLKPPTLDLDFPCPTHQAIIVGHRSQLDLAAVGLAISLANVTGALDLCDAMLDFIL